MIRHRCPLAWLLIFAVAAASTGCTAMKTVKPRTDPSQPRFGPVKPDDTVVLHLTDGRRVEITVAGVERDALVSAEGVRYPHAEIAQLQTRSFSALKTLGLVGGVYLATAAIIAAALSILW